VKRTITKEDTLLGAKIKLSIVVRAQMRLTSTTEHTEKCVVRSFTEEAFQGTLHIDDTARKPIDKKACRRKSITPIGKRNRRMS
jgi:hypothetical protein